MRAEQPEMSIVIPFHTSAVTNVLAALALAKSVEKCEIILVSDGVPSEQVRRIAEFHHRLQLAFVDVPKCGRIGRLRNLGIARARANLLYFIDSDCIVERNTLEAALAAAHRGDIVRGKIYFVASTWMSQLDAQIRTERYESDTNFAYCPNLLVRRDVFTRIGPYSEQFTYGSDGEFAKRVVESGLRVHYESGMTLTHDCTDSIFGVFGKWMSYGEGRYLRYKGRQVDDKIATYFPNLFREERGAVYNIAAAICNVGRAVGIINAIIRKK